MTNMKIVKDAVDEKSYHRIVPMEMEVIFEPSKDRIKDTRPRGLVLDFLAEMEQKGFNSNCLYNLDMSIEIDLWKYEGVKFITCKGKATVKQTI